MPYCTACGRELSPDAKYCDRCGAEQSSGRPDRQGQPPQQPPASGASTGGPTRQQPADGGGGRAPRHKQGEQRRSRGNPPRGARPSEAFAPTPTWPLGVLVGCWVLWIVGIGIYNGGTQPVGGLVALVAVLGSLPVMYIDAKNAKQAGELELEYPLAVPLATLLLWVLALPAYVLYRWTSR